MYGDSLQQAINTINNYLENGNTLYLFNENSRNCFKLSPSDTLSYTLQSKIQSTILEKEHNSSNLKNNVSKLKDKSEYLKVKDSLDWREVYR